MAKDYWDEIGYHLDGTLWLVSPSGITYGVPDPTEEEVKKAKEKK